MDLGMEQAKFKCPKCNHNEVEEVLVNACVSSLVARIYPEELECASGYVLYGGDIDRYQCIKCGYIVAKTIEELYEKCKENM